MTVAYVVRHHKQFFRCPFCGHSRTASIRPRRPIGSWGERWWVGCVECENGGDEGQEYLHRLAEAVECRPFDLLARGDEVLADLLIRPRRDVDSKGARLPSIVEVEAWVNAL